jgi:hypothetical protein
MSISYLVMASINTGGTFGMAEYRFLTNSSMEIEKKFWFVLYSSDMCNLFQLLYDRSHKQFQEYIHITTFPSVKNANITNSPVCTS